MTLSPPDPSPASATARSAIRKWVVVSCPAVVAGLSAVELVLYFRFHDGTLRPGLEWCLHVAHVLWSCTPVALASVGALISLRRPAHRVGVLLSFAALLAGASTLAGTFGHVTAFQRRYVVVGSWLLDERWGRVALWIPSWAAPIAFGLATAVLFLLFPDGNLPSRRWRPVAVFVGAAIVLFAVRGAFGTNPYVILTGFELRALDVLSLQLSVLGRTMALVTITFQVAVVLAALALISRYRRADQEGRLQLKWVVSAAALAAALHLAPSALHLMGRLTTEVAVFVHTAAAGARLLLPIAIGIAILRYRLYGIDAVLTRAIVFGGMSLFISVTYVAVSTGVGTVLTDDASAGGVASVVAAGPVAAGFAPIRRRTRRFANRVVYGERVAPYEVLARFAHGPLHERPGADAAARLARAIGTGLRTARVGVYLEREDRTDCVASWPVGSVGGQGGEGGVADVGGDRAPDVSVPITLRGDPVGRIDVFTPAGEVATPEDRRLLRLLASYAAVALHNVRIADELAQRRAELDRRAAELQESRLRIVRAHLDARRAVEADIRREVVPMLAHVPALLAGLGDPEQSSEDIAIVLSDAEVATTSALDALRSIAHGVYSPLVDELGVAAALESHLRDARAAATVRTGQRSGDPHRLERVVRAALYSSCIDLVRVASKESAAGPLDIRIDVDESWVELRCTGPSFDPLAHAGPVVLREVADRLEAVGGSLDVIYSSGVRGVVIGRVPIVEEAA